jgi:hypothetical protein
MNPDHTPFCQICAQYGKYFSQLLSSTHMFENKKMSRQNISKGKRGMDSQEKMPHYYIPE